MRKTEIVDSGCLLLDISPNWPFDPHDTRPWLEFDERWSFTQKLHRRWSCQKWPWLYWDDVSSAMIQIFGGTKKIVDSGYGCCMTFLQIDLWYDTKHLPSWPLKPRLCEAHPHVKLETPRSRRRIQNNIISFNNAIGTSDKGTKKWPPLWCFFACSKSSFEWTKSLRPSKARWIQSVFGSWASTSSPPQKSCDRSYACETLERMFGACAKRDGRTGLSRTILQDGVLCKVNVKLTSPLRKKHPGVFTLGP